MAEDNEAWQTELQNLRAELETLKAQIKQATPETISELQAQLQNLTTRLAEIAETNNSQEVKQLTTRLEKAEQQLAEMAIPPSPPLPSPEDDLQEAPPKNLAARVGWL